MTAIQGTSLYSFIYMCIVQASSTALGLFFWWISDGGVCVHVSAIQYVKHLIFSMQYIENIIFLFFFRNQNFSSCARLAINLCLTVLDSFKLG